MPGRYRGSITLRSAAHADWSVDLETEVYNLALPDALPIAAVGGFDHRDLFAGLLRRDGKGFSPVCLDRDINVVEQLEA